MITRYILKRLKINPKCDCEIDMGGDKVCTTLRNGFSEIVLLSICFVKDTDLASQLME